MKRNPWFWVAVTVLVVGGIVLGVRLSEKPEYTPNYDIPYMSMGYTMSQAKRFDYVLNLLNGKCPGDDAKMFRIIHSKGELVQILFRAESRHTEMYTRELTFDDAFFEENALLLIDISHNPGAWLYARPENLTEENGKVSLTVEWDTDGSWVANSCGVLLAIPVSLNCVDADITYVRADWLESTQMVYR